jgi:hypothetical protein
MGVCIPIGHIEVLLASLYKSLLRVWRDADVTELLNLRMKSILAGDLNAKHPVWNSQVSNPSGLKLLDLFVNCNFEILVPQHPTHFIPDGRGDVLVFVVHKDVRPNTSLLASMKVPVFFLLWYGIYPVDSHRQHRPAADVSHLISVPPGFPGPS